MEKLIATKTKVLLWAVMGEKERLDFDLCDFSPEQVGGLNRLIREDGENSVRLTIDPEQKKLQIAPITVVVRLVSLYCRGKGQKLKIGGFASPDERATAIKRLIAAETPVVLTIEPIQAGLPFDEKKQTAQDTKRGRTCRLCGTNDETCEDCNGRRQCGPAACDWAEIDLCKECAGKGVAVKPEGFSEDPPHGEDPKSDGTTEELIVIKCTGTKQAWLKARIKGGGARWDYAYEIQLGNYVNIASSDGVCPSRRTCLEVLKDDVHRWLDELQITGTADHKRSIQARRDQMKEQIDAGLDKLIRVDMKTMESP